MHPHMPAKYPTLGVTAGGASAKGGANPNEGAGSKSDAKHADDKSTGNNSTRNKERSSSPAGAK